MKLGKIKEFTDFSNDSNSSFEVSYTPDEEYIISGSDDGNIYIWEIETGKKVATLPGHGGKVGCVKFNPRYLMMASSCTNLAFWIPTITKSSPY